MSASRILTLFAIPDTSPALAVAQLSALKKQVPLLYLILTINAATLAYTHFGLAPHSLVLVPVLVLGGICMLRTWAWTRLDLSSVAPERYIPLLRRTNRLTALLSPAFLVWSLSLAQYGTEATNVHVFFFLALTPIACIFCLMHLRSAALIIVCTVSAPAVMFVLHKQEAVLRSIAVNQLMVGAVMIFILFVYYRDFGRLVRQNQALEDLGTDNLRLASTDMLTGLPNRRSFFPSLEEMLRRHSEIGAAFTLGIIDLDGFKGVNDTYGHVAGDRVLVEVAERLMQTVPEGAQLARLGGDEFALLMHDDHGLTLDQLSQTIFTTINRPFVCNGATARIGASIGFARFAEAGTTTTQLIERADFALYEAKASRRGSWILFGKEHDERMHLQGAVENALRHADLAAEFSLVFQPMVDFVRRRTIAFESLARWHSPQLGKIPPNRFIAAAERIGLINELTRVFLSKAFEAMEGWPEDVGLSFNLSMADITSPEAMTCICAMVEASKIEPTRLQFEVTETAMLSDFAQAKASLVRLKALGVALSLDDFGTGYSSLSHVHRLPVDKLKIDQSFVRDLIFDEGARNIVASTIGLSRSLRLDCVVEGVETIEQALILQSLGGRVMQGYLFHKPMPQDAVLQYLLQEKIDQASDPSNDKVLQPQTNRTCMASEGSA